MARNSTRPIKTFSVGFDAEINELPFAKKVAERYKTDHTEIIIQSDIQDLLPEVVRYYDEPFADNSNIPTWLISKEARKHVKVILTGDGGDELFAGYGSYITQRYYSNSRVLSKLMSTVDRASTALTGKTCLDWSYPFQSNKGAVQHWLSIKECFNESEIMRLCKFPFESPRRLLSGQPFLEIGSDDPLSVAYAHDFNYYLPDDLLKKVDMASMGNSLETRTPFLDYRLVEFSMKIAPELKVKNNQSKYLLKKALTEFLPRDILYREKQGFGAPIGGWIHGPLKETAQDALSGGCKLEGFLNREQIKEVVDNVYSESSQDWRADHKLWVLFMFELWMREYA